MDISDRHSLLRAADCRYRPLGGEDFAEEWPLEHRELAAEFARSYGAIAGFATAIVLAVVVSWSLFRAEPGSAPIAQAGPEPTMTGSLATR